MLERLKIIKEQIAFAATDTICFFTPSPQELLELQQKEWSPVIKWINGFGCDFKVSEDLNVQKLSKQTENFLQKRLDSLTDEELEAFCAVSGGCRSVILALAVLDGFLTAEQAFECAVLEENYQNKIWQKDPDAIASREGRRQSVLEASIFLKGKTNG